MKNILISVLSLYKNYFSVPLAGIFGSACRFTPTCSEYTIEALKKYGFPKGLKMGIKRVGNCHPWGGCGFDPVK